MLICNNNSNASTARKCEKSLTKILSLILSFLVVFFMIPVVSYAEMIETAEELLSGTSDETAEENLMNCSVNDEPVESVDFISATISGVISGAVGGKGANGKKLRGIVRKSKEAIKSSVSQSQIAKYTLKIRGAKLEAIDSTLRTVVGSISSNLFNGASNFLLN